MRKDIQERFGNKKEVRRRLAYSQVSSHLERQERPGAERWSDWSARCHGYRPPRGRRPRCSTCEAVEARNPSARAYSGDSARCTSTGPLHRHTHIELKHSHEELTINVPVDSLGN